ncbi:MAG: hypothetical protein Ct9H300mP1_24930 [Planctomycetaceae bacterium]|nr:MAG: hypothetical protein Ct9H300mP1_24930 [Planctomycetaceae bacterium]
MRQFETAEMDGETGHHLSHTCPSVAKPSSYRLRQGRSIRGNAPGPRPAALPRFVDESCATSTCFAPGPPSPPPGLDKRRVVRTCVAAIGHHLATDAEPTEQVAPRVPPASLRALSNISPPAVKGLPPPQELAPHLPSRVGKVQINGRRQHRGTQHEKDQQQEHTIDQGAEFDRKRRPTLPGYLIHRLHRRPRKKGPFRVSGFLRDTFAPENHSSNCDATHCICNAARPATDCSK